MNRNDDRISPTTKPTNVGNGVGRVCAHCEHRIPAGSGQGALIPDATVVDPHDPARDGQRYVTACGSEHLQVLIDQARRDWVEEQLWFGQLSRASVHPGMVGVLITDLAEYAHLSNDHLWRALEWNTRRPSPSVTLPGGQIVPASHPRPVSPSLPT